MTSCNAAELTLGTPPALYDFSLGASRSMLDLGGSGVAIGVWLTGCPSKHGLTLDKGWRCY